MEDFEYYAVNVYATNQNFPDESMEDIIEDVRDIEKLLAKAKDL